MKQRYIILLLLSIVTCIDTVAREYLLMPQWYTGKSDFREAFIDKDGRLVDEYTQADSDTVNVADTGVKGDYSLNISFNICNLHGNPHTRYSQYYRDDNGEIKRGKSVNRPIYGWVWGMNDMQHYNAILMRSGKGNDVLYDDAEIEFCVVTINGNDTVYHVEWRHCHYQSNAFNSELYTVWIQYSNNTAWIGGGWSYDIPWAVVRNIPSFGTFTGLYLGAASKVSVGDVFISVEDKELPQRTRWTVASLKDYFCTTHISPVEGFWSIKNNQIRSQNAMLGGSYELAIVANGENYDVIYLSGAEKYPGKWHEGDVKGRLKYVRDGFYEVVWYDAEGEMIKNVYMTSHQNNHKICFEDEKLILALQPSTIHSIARESNITTKTASCGTGFALSSDGYIVTNHHIVSTPGRIVVKNGNGSYHAEIVLTDETNDLAILRINDENFVTSEEIPYGFDNRSITAGEDIFYFGYSTRDFMSANVNTSAGNVTAVNSSSLSTYMMSVDNDMEGCGSPVFDKSGNIVGVVVETHTNDMRISAYHAVKVPYLYDLIELLPSPIIMPKNKIKELSHPDMVKTITPYIYKIEIIRE